MATRKTSTKVKSTTSKRNKSIKSKTSKKESNVAELNKLNVSNESPLHENFREYTTKELIEIKKTNCIAHQCPYLSKMNWAAKSKHSGSTIHIICNYILIAGHSRGCMPDVCRHWKDKDVKIQRTTNTNLFDNHVDFE